MRPNGSLGPMTPYVSPDTSHRLLSRVPLLESLDEGRLRALWERSTGRTVPGGDVLRRVGEPAAHLLLLLDGRVAVETVSPTGRTVRFGTRVGPCALDKVAVVDGGGHTATLRALVPCRVRSLPRAAFLELVDDVAAVRRHALRVLAAQARGGQDAFTAAATLPGAARLAAWLLGEAAAADDLTVVITQQELGDRLGLSRVTVNRALSRFRREGLIETAPRSIKILAPELVRLRARGD
jgi:CRP/FNR family transcriptional regulator, cyclic AMP receptor protein